MAQSTISNLSALYKTLYPKGLEVVATKSHPFLNMIQKRDIFYGNTLTLPIVHGFPMGRSATFLNAQSGVTSSRAKAFNLTRQKDYAITTIDGEALKASEREVGAFIRARKLEMDGMLEALGNSLAHASFRDGDGAIGQRSSAATNVITLVQSLDADHFEVGQTIEASPNADGSSPRSGTTTVASVQRDDGTVTLTAAANIIGFADSDYLFVKGDSSTDQGKITGLAGWLPLTAPTAGDSHFGVDRSEDDVRLAGNRLDNASGSIEDNLLSLCERITRRGGMPDCAFMHPTKWVELEKSLGSKVQYNQVGGTAGIGFKAIEVHGPRGSVMILADFNCPPDRCYVLQKNTWAYYSMGKVPHIITDDGNQSLREVNADGIEVRARYFTQLGCDRPAYNGVMSVG